MRTDRYVPAPAPYLLYGFLGVSLALNTYMVVKVTGDDDADDPAVVEAADPVETVEVTEAAVQAADAPVQVDEPEPLDIQEPSTDGWTVVNGTISHSLARTFQKELGREEGDVVSAVYSRLFMWDLDLRKDLQKGDEVTVVYRIDDAGDVEMPDAPLLVPAHRIDARVELHVAAQVELVGDEVQVAEVLGLGGEEGEILAAVSR